MVVGVGGRQVLDWSCHTRSGKRMGATVRKGFMIAPQLARPLFGRKLYFRFRFEGFINKETPLVTQIDNFNLTLIENH